jgi:N-acetylmuramoyl-L-alanine amidase
MALVNSRKLMIAKRLLLFVIVSVFFWTIIPSTASAAVDDNDVPWSVPEAKCKVGGSTGKKPSSGTENDGTVRATGIGAPYIVEQFAIEVLKTVAQKRGVSEADTVTEEHVVALVSFIHMEGGDIANRSSIFNPLNTGLNAPELLDGAAAADGTQSYKSFDAGVEAMARTMVGSNQARLADTVIIPNSTAEEFFTALALWNNYEGNWPYAGASVIGGYNKDGTPDPKYLQHALDLLKNVRESYVDRAGTVLGTDALEWADNIREPGLVKYGGGAGNTPNSAGAGGCVCDASAAGGSVIVIDPGHGAETDTTDALTGLRDHDYPNTPEEQDVLDVSNIVKTKLTEEGYTVKMTKNAVGETASLRQRASIANDAGAALAVSIHDQAGAEGGLNFADYAEVYAQGMGKYRQTADGTQIQFTNADVATKSQEYASKIAEARAAAEGRAVPVKDADFNGREAVAPGNIPLVQLFSTVPWVYNEVGGNSAAGVAGLSQGDKEKYATGIIEGVKQAVPKQSDKEGTAACSGAVGAVQGNIAQTAVNFSWPTREEGKAMKPNEAYAAAVLKFPGSPFNGADCGGFVSIVMQASGADPNYPKAGTGNQEAYVRDHPELYDVVDSVASTEDLQPGDIMIVNAGGGQGSSGHTYIFVGAQPSGDDIAHASMNERMPNLGKAFLSDERGSYLRARLKKVVE